MSKSIQNEILPENLTEHRAVRAWAALKPARVEPNGIEILKLKNKSAVYRLTGVGEDGAAVIAKRCLATTATIERMIYEELLPRLPLATLRYYGHVNEPDGKFVWLFIENADGLAYSPRDAEHRALAARWLAALQTTALTTDLGARLPLRDADFYLNRLHETRGLLSVHTVNPELRADELASLEKLVTQLDALEARWPELHAACDGLTPTVVHGDLVTKNVSVRANPDGLELLVFDWEYAGWGVPATDLSQFVGRTLSPDLEVFCAATHGPLHGGADQNIRRLAECGKFFRLIDDIHWASSLLTFESHLFLEKPASYLKSYQPRLAAELHPACATS
ncbi:MAG: hypothetical protein EPO07_13995 [Verrucomicrobia bacterium]|nr:MAG: hypothetical protein EPO07_13995 [Verrucomicrobiota bacterium]